MFCCAELCCCEAVGYMKIDGQKIQSFEFINMGEETTNGDHIIQVSKFSRSYFVDLTYSLASQVIL